MQKYNDCPQVLRDFLAYHENIKSQSPKTISEYFLTNAREKIYNGYIKEKGVPLCRAKSF